ERLEEAEAIVSDVYYEIEAREDAAGFIDNLENLESRHQQLRVAMRRYATDEEGLLERHAALKEEIEHLENLRERMEEIDALVDRTYKVAAQCADRLDAERREASESFFAQVAASLAHLEMRGATLNWPANSDESKPKLTAHGWDNIEIFFSANEGERAQPLGNVASGEIG